VGGWAEGWADGKTRGECGFSSLVKQKNRGKNTLSFTSPEKRFVLYL
jgi:hypothetical protein